MSLSNTPRSFNVACCYRTTTHRLLQTASQRDHVLSAQANALFGEGRYFPAAQCYAQSSVDFEEVALKYLDVGERDALRSYLVSRLERTRKAVCHPTPDIMRSSNLPYRTQHSA